MSAQPDHVPDPPVAASGPPPLLSGLRSMDRRQRRRAITVAIARAVGAVIVLLVIYAVLPVRARSETELCVRIGVALVLLVAVVGWQLWAVNRAELPQLRAIEALAVTVTVVVVSFAIAYLNLSDYDVASFDEALGRTGALYFTLTTSATVGYGDIYAKTDPARILVMIQMVANVVLVGASVKMIVQVARYRIATPRTVRHEGRHHRTGRAVSGVRRTRRRGRDEPPPPGPPPPEPT